MVTQCSEQPKTTSYKCFYARVSPAYGLPGRLTQYYSNPHQKNAPSDIKNYFF